VREYLCLFGVHVILRQSFFAHWQFFMAGFGGFGIPATGISVVVGTTFERVRWPHFSKGTSMRAVFFLLICGIFVLVRMFFMDMQDCFENWTLFLLRRPKTYLAARSGCLRVLLNARILPLAVLTVQVVSWSNIVMRYLLLR
jgi:hypothetical protein